MTFDPSLIFSVRRYLNEIPEDYLTDEIIYDSLVRAEKWIDTLLAAPDTTYRTHCLIVTAAYFVYVNYTVGLERAVGTLPATVASTLAELRRLVYYLVKPYAKLPIDENLTINDDHISGRPIVATLSESELI